MRAAPILPILCSFLNWSCAGDGVRPEGASTPTPETLQHAPNVPDASVVGEPTTAGVEAAFRELLDRMSVQYLPRERRIEVPGWVNMQQGLIEVFACAPEGKTHESVVVLDCVPSGIHAGLLALGLEPGRPVELGTAGDYQAPTGDGVEIRVRWTEASGATRTARAEDWIWNESAGQPMQPCAWIFAGSFMQPVSGDSERSTYAANYVKSIVTTYHDATSILENPNLDGADDTVYYANEKSVPPVGTPVTVLFSPAE